MGAGADRGFSFNRIKTPLARDHSNHSSHSPSTSQRIIVCDVVYCVRSVHHSTLVLAVSRGTTSVPANIVCD